MEHVLDAGVLAAMNRAVVCDVIGVDHAVLAGAEIHECRFHAGKDVLDPPQVDVAHQ